MGQMSAILDIIIWGITAGFSCFLLAETRRVKYCWKGYYSLRILLCGLVFWSVCNILDLISLPTIDMYSLIEHAQLMIMLGLMLWFVITHPETF